MRRFHGLLVLVGVLVTVLILTPGVALATPGVCGSSAGQAHATKPTTNLCSLGNASTVSGSGPWTWTCTTSGHQPTACQATKSVPPVNGNCGSSDGKTVSSKPTSGLCSSGVATAVSGSGPWAWSCAGENGGSTDTCNADKVAPPACGNGTKESGEACDDGNSKSGDGCTSQCTLESCGNGVVDMSEACDDGNSKSGDGCSAVCAKENDDEPKDDDDDDEDTDCNGSIGNFVWNDKNGDGVQDAGEAGISGVGVWLYRGNDIDKEKTNGNGEYEFDDLCAGHYTVVVKSEDVPLRTLTSDPDGVKDHKTKVSITRKEDYTKADFGYKTLVAPATGPGWVAFLISAASAVVALAVIAKILSRRRKQVA